MGALEVIYYVKDTVFISERLLQPCIITSGLWFIWEKPLQLSESVTIEYLDIFFKKSKNGFYGNSLADCKTCNTSSIYLSSKIIYKVDFN